MAYGIVNIFKGGTKAQYDATVKVVHPDQGMPAGQIHRVAGETGDGFLVTAVWDSEASWDKFRDEHLLPGLAELGDKGLPGPPQMISFEVHDQEHA